MLSHSFFYKNNWISGILVDERWVHVNDLPEGCKPINCNVKRAEYLILKDRLEK